MDHETSTTIDTEDDQPEQVTAEHIIDLAESPAVDPALVRYDDDGSLEVRSLVPGGDGGEYRIVVERDGLYDIADWDGGEMSEETAAVIAEYLNDNPPEAEHGGVEVWHDDGRFTYIPS